MRDIETRKDEEVTQVFADLEQEENSAETDQAPKSSPARLSRNRRAPDRYGLPVTNSFETFNCCSVFHIYYSSVPTLYICVSML